MCIRDRHSYEIAKRLSDKGRLIGIDQDADAIKAAEMCIRDRLGVAPIKPGDTVIVK